MEEYLKEELFADKLNEGKSFDERKLIVDSDNDGIADELELHGYTIEEGLIVPWDEQKHGFGGFYKYFSDPYDSHTAGGPYSDNEKVLGKIDGLNEATHPLVATYPRIIVELEKIILSKNVTVSKEKQTSASKETSNTVSISTSNSHTDSTSVNVTASVETDISIMPSAKVSVSVSTSLETSNTVTAEHSSSETSGQTLGKMISDSLSLNHSEAAFLNANIRYINIGTMPIYNFTPTINFVLGIGKNAETIATISAKSNTFAKFVLPGEKYPNANQNAIAWNTSDDFNSQPIKLNYDQIMKLAKGVPLQIQVTQIEGEYKKYDADGNQYNLQDFKWEYVLPDIYRKTALITIAFADGQTFERRIAARSIHMYHLQTKPEIKLGEAMELAFPGLKIINNEIHYQGKILKKSNLNLIINRMTEEIIKDASHNNFFDIVLTKEMQFMFVEIKTEKEIEDTKDDNIDDQYQEKIDLQFFKKIQEKLEYFNGTTFDHHFDLQEKIGFKHKSIGGLVEKYGGKETPFDPNLLEQMLKDFLLKNNIPEEIVAKLHITWDQANTLEEFYWEKANPKTWYKTTTLHYQPLFKTYRFPLYVKNLKKDHWGNI